MLHCLYICVHDAIYFLLCIWEALARADVTPDLYYVAYISKVNSCLTKVVGSQLYCCVLHYHQNLFLLMELWNMVSYGINDLELWPASWPLHWITSKMDFLPFRFLKRKIVKFEMLPSPFAKKTGYACSKPKFLWLYERDSVAYKETTWNFESRTHVIFKYTLLEARS